MRIKIMKCFHREEFYIIPKMQPHFPLGYLKRFGIELNQFCTRHDIHDHMKYVIHVVELDI